MRVVVGMTVLGFALLAAGAARGEMTEADEAGKRAFVACVEEAGGDEDVCVEKLGLYAWFPLRGTACETVGARVEKVIELDGQPKWRDLFRNERCARLGLPHGEGAARAGVRWNQLDRYAQCSELDTDRLDCKEKFGRHAWHPYDETDCPKRGLVLQEKRFRAQGSPFIRSMLFKTERCRRLGFPFFVPGATQ